MKKAMRLVAISLFISCGNQKQMVTPVPEVRTLDINKTVPDSEEDTIILLGLANEEGFKQAPFNSWYSENYSDYTVDETTTASLKHLLKDVKIKIFMGTWCSDSQRETPRIYKVLSTAGYAEKHIELITLTREKDTPAGYEVGLDITHVPTVIFYKNDKEMNRIVESSVTSLEKDMIAILTGQAYKHTYAD